MLQFQRIEEVVQRRSGSATSSEYSGIFGAAQARRGLAGAASGGGRAEHVKFECAAAGPELFAILPQRRAALLDRLDLGVEAGELREHDAATVAVALSSGPLRVGAGKASIMRLFVMIGLRGAVLLLLAALLPLATATDRSPCSVGRPASVVCQLNDTRTLEYELRWNHGWQWFVLETHDMAAVSAGLVLQRGASRNFPRMGFVMMASTSGVPPGTLMEGGYDPTTYAHDDPVGRGGTSCTSRRSTASGRTPTGR